jgi:TraM recognition site of TraD and TraG
MLSAIIGVFAILVVVSVAVVIGYTVYQGMMREAKNYERGLKMIPMLIHLPPTSEDLERGGRDEREVTDELLSQAQVMYNIIASTAQRGFKHRIYGQRHVSFEIVAKEGLIYYYTVVPIVLVDVVRQAVIAAYPSARLEEVEEHNIFSQDTHVSSVIGGEFSLKKDYVYPIATYQDTKRDASRAILNALSTIGREDGVGIQILMRPAAEGWTKNSQHVVEKVKKDRATGRSSGFAGSVAIKDVAGALWKPPSADDHNDEKNVDRQLTSSEQQGIEAIEEKIRYPGYEMMIRVVVSSSTAARSQTLLKNIVAAFSLFDSPTNNGFVFTPTRNVDELVTSYIFRFFPQGLRSNVLNTVELATLFHLPDQKNIPTAQVKRQMSKQVDGPTDVMDEGFLIGYNEFRGVKKPIRLSTNDRRRHLYMIGQTGTGKSKFLENLAYQDMMDGKGFAFIDPHGDSAEVLMGAVPKERVEDIIYFNPADMDNPIGLNMFEYNTPDQKDFLVQEAINMLYGLYDPGHTGIVGPRLEHIFRNAALLLMADPEGGTFIDIPKVLVDAEFMKSKLKYVTDPTVIEFWTKEWPASQKSSEAGELVSWVASKFGPFLSNDAMRNIIGQTKSGFNLRDIMDNKKILIVNLSKGKMGELNSKLLGIIFVMKFQAAAMARADIPEDQREDFSLYVDEFQNFMTESFESILSEARKYHLSLIMANQFMTQLTDKIREAIIGNVGTVVSGRIGVTDAELLVKKFDPVFTVDDLTKMPNFQGITSVMINNTPSAPFSMSFTPPLAKSNDKLADAMKKLSATKHGRPRAEVEADIAKRIATRPKPAMAPGTPTGNRIGAPGAKPAGGGSFLDEWLAKRQQAGAGRPGVIRQPGQPLPAQGPGLPQQPGVSGAPMPQMNLNMPQQGGQALPYQPTSQSTVGATSAFGQAQQFQGAPQRPPVAPGPMWQQAPVTNNYASPGSQQPFQPQSMMQPSQTGMGAAPSQPVATPVVPQPYVAPSPQPVPQPSQVQPLPQPTSDGEVSIKIR